MNYAALDRKISLRGGTFVEERRTLTERMAKRMRQGRLVPDADIVRWAEQYALCRKYGEITRRDAK
jgi:hypothetical protein